MMRSARFETASAALRNWPSAFSRCWPNRAGAGRCAHDGMAPPASSLASAGGRLVPRFCGSRRGAVAVTADHSELSDDHWPAYRDQLIDVACEEPARAGAACQFG